MHGTRKPTSQVKALKYKSETDKRILYISKASSFPGVVIQRNIDIRDAAIFAKQASKIFGSNKRIERTNYM